MLNLFFISFPRSKRISTIKAGTEINISYRYFPGNQFIEQQSTLANDYNFVCQCSDCLAKCRTLEICLKCARCDNAPIIYLQNFTAKCLKCQQLDIHYWKRLSKLIQNGTKLKFITKYFSTLNFGNELIATLLADIERNCLANSNFIWKSIELAADYSINNEDNNFNVDYLFKLLDEQCQFSDSNLNIFQRFDSFQWNLCQAKS